MNNGFYWYINDRGLEVVQVSLESPGDREQTVFRCGDDVPYDLSDMLERGKFLGQVTPPEGGRHD